MLGGSMAAPYIKRCEENKMDELEEFKKILINHPDLFEAALNLVVEQLSFSAVPSTEI